MFIRQSILIRILGRGHTQLNNIYYEMIIYQSLLITVGPSEGGGDIHLINIIMIITKNGIGGKNFPYPYPYYKEFK